MPAEPKTEPKTEPKAARGPEDAAPHARRGRRKKYLLSALVVVALLAGGGVAVGKVTARPDGGPQRAGARGALPPATDTVRRQDLSSSTQVDGTLGYAKEHKVNGGAAGTLTWLPGTGSTIARDGALYEVDGHKVRLMYGEKPMYRTLKEGDEGDDVRQLKENLRALGYGDALAVDDEFTAGTTDAVKRWQRAHDLRQTGTTGPDQISFQPGSVRINKKDMAVGDQTAPGRPVLTTTGSAREVLVKLDVEQADLAKPGTKVTVNLPGGGTARGKVASVDRTVTEEGSDPASKTPKITARITFADPGEVTSFDRSPVTVDIVGEVREDVLTVPVDALLALPGGGFGVEVVEGGRAREVRVKLGMFGQGRVEISGGGLEEGMKVGVPKA
ncbi:efflux RND transporter periplasmic adaptor subunit [Streptomyces piniterrae]|uniref:Efflux RND transporter periplasmic adaptor subunit n=1 Tax=Streptomyces piniterrae TaxID=2571125 RepID=A0A4U0N8B6_9ACTN|nr:peptidoglycan-binding protein [Streptomyces piniterrae]TJZ50091.1 efflux RND transporter periplasmic adaptor subunit [Streptomyces piniterrae]